MTLEIDERPRVPPGRLHTVKGPIPDITVVTRFTLFSPKVTSVVVRLWASLPRPLVGCVSSYPLPGTRFLFGV